MGVVEDPAADAQKILEALVADEILPVHADPVQEGLVGADDGAVRQGREIAAGGVLVELLGVSMSGPWSMVTLRRSLRGRVAQEGFHGGDGLLGRAQVRAMPGGLHWTNWLPARFWCT